jgi:galactoside O-acetyltransferase
MAFLTRDQINAIGFKSVGEQTLISEKAVFYNPGNISIGDNSRIDDFCILSAGEGIEIGNYVHIACFVTMIGKSKIIVKDYAGVSGKCSIYSSTDTFDGSVMTGPCVPAEFIKLYSKEVVLEKHVVVGTGTVILPGVTLDKGCAVGCSSVVNKSFPVNTIVAGIPAKKIKDRKTNIYNLEILLLDQFPY